MDTSKRKTNLVAPFIDTAGLSKTLSAPSMAPLMANAWLDALAVFVLMLTINDVIVVSKRSRRDARKRSWEARGEIEAVSTGSESTALRIVSVVAPPMTPAPTHGKMTVRYTGAATGRVARMTGAAKADAIEPRKDATMS